MKAFAVPFKVIVFLYVGFIAVNTVDGTLSRPRSTIKNTVVDTSEDAEIVDDTSSSIAPDASITRFFHDAQYEGTEFFSDYDGLFARKMKRWKRDKKTNPNTCYPEDYIGVWEYPSPCKGGSIFQAIIECDGAISGRSKKKKYHKGSSSFITCEYEERKIADLKEDGEIVPLDEPECTLSGTFRLRANRNDCDVDFFQLVGGTCTDDFNLGLKISLNYESGEKNLVLLFSDDGGTDFYNAKEPYVATVQDSYQNGRYMLEKFVGHSLQASSCPSTQNKNCCKSFCQNQEFNDLNEMTCDSGSGCKYLVCSNSEITNVKKLTCEGFGAPCSGVKVYDVEELICSGFQSCSEAQVLFVTKSVTCSNRNACLNTQIIGNPSNDIDVVCEDTVNDVDLLNAEVQMVCGSDDATKPAIIDVGTKGSLSCIKSAGGFPGCGHVEIRPSCDNLKFNNRDDAKNVKDPNGNICVK